MCSGRGKRGIIDMDITMLWKESLVPWSYGVSYMIRVGSIADRVPAPPLNRSCPDNREATGLTKQATRAGES